MKKSTAHGLFFHGIAEGELGLRKSKKIEVLKNRWSIFLLHEAAAGAARILSVNIAGSLHKNRAAARRIHALPVLPRFHVHSLVSPFPGVAGMCAKDFSVWIGSKGKVI